MRGRHLIFLVSGGISLASLAPACVSAKSPSDMLVVAQNISDIVSLDPAQAYELTGEEVIANVYDRLVEIDLADPAQIAPGLAQSWSITGDGKTVTFRLRPGSRFASGDPVRPQDVAFSLRRVVQLNKAPAGLLTQLGWTPDNVTQTIRPVSDDEVALTIEADVSASFLLRLLASDTCSIVDRDVAMTHAEGGDLGNGWLSRHSAGSGAYSLGLWEPNEAVLLRANPNHLGRVPRMRQVVLDHVAEPSTQRLMLQTGDADIAYDLSPDQIAALAGNRDILATVYPQGVLYFFSLNQQSEKLRNPAIWRAMRYLVDYDGIAHTLLQDSLKVHQSFWPSGFPGAVDDTPYKLDVAKALSILREGGVSPGLTIDMDVIAASPFIEIAQSIQTSMAQAGITLNLLPGTAAQVITKYRSRSQEMMLLYWNPDFMDPHSNAQNFAYNIDNSDHASLGTAAWRNSWLIPELSALTERALVERDPDRRLDLYRDLQRRIMGEAPWVMMFQVQKQIAMRRTIQGFVQGPLAGLLHFDRVVKE